MTRNVVALVAFGIVYRVNLGLHVHSGCQPILCADNSVLQVHVVVLVSVGCIITLGLVQDTMFPEVAIVSQAHAKLGIHGVKDGAYIAVIVRKTITIVVTHLDEHLVAHRLGIRKASAHIPVFRQRLVILCLVIDGVFTGQGQYLVIIHLIIRIAVGLAL